MKESSAIIIHITYITGEGVSKVLIGGQAAARWGSRTYLTRPISKGASGDRKDLFAMFREYWQTQTVGVELAKIIIKVTLAHTHTPFVAFDQRFW